MNIDFFTTIRYENPQTFKEYVQEGIEDYFYLGGKSAYIISKNTMNGSQEVVIRDTNQSKTKQVLLGALKILSYASLVIPLIMLGAKIIFRCTHNFYLRSFSQEIDPLLPFHTRPTPNTIPNPTNLSSSSSSSSSSFFPLPKNSVDENEELLPPTFEDKDLLKLTTLSSSAKELMHLFISTWKNDAFDLPENFFDPDVFVQQLYKHTEQFRKRNVNNIEHFGYIEKIDLLPEENPQIYVRADLHGDLKSLIENIRTLQAEGLLNEDFQCTPGVHLVFLGDYCDRGIYGTEILILLMRLREENPHQVHLIRGNHEYINTNKNYSANDTRLQMIVNHSDAAKYLEDFYATMSLTSYFSLNTGEERDYIQCTHGLFELTTDPAPLLDSPLSSGHLPIEKRRELSERIKKIANSDCALSESAKRIRNLVNSQKEDSYLTAYNWADISTKETVIGSLGYRRYKLSAADISHYLSLSSQHHKVSMIFRGHQHSFQNLMHEGEVLVTTLPVGMDSPYKELFKGQQDRSYIIQPQKSVKEWKKRAILRSSGKEDSTVTKEKHPLTSDAI